MDDLDPARANLDATIAMLEALMDALMNAQAPRSTKYEIIQALLSMREMANALSATADQIESDVKTSLHYGG